jgi:hypothetical protein
MAERAAARNRAPRDLFLKVFGVSMTSKCGARASASRSCVYIHRNPVERGLVETPDQWKWSSFRSYAYGETEPVVVNDWSVLKMNIRVA